MESASSPDTLLPAANTNTVPLLDRTPGRTRPRAQAATRSGLASLLWTFAAMALGATLRLPETLNSRFPLGDGGMFYVMVHELGANHFAIPAYTSYDGLHIPFDYPPFGFYLVATLHLLFAWPVLDIFRFLPAFMSVATIGAFALLAFSVLPSRVAAIASVFVFAIDFDAFEWQIKAGGITRSPGMFFALLFLWVVVLTLKSGGWRYVPIAAALAALTALSHLEWTWFSAITVCVFLVLSGRNRRSLLQMAAVLAGALVLLSPWLHLVLSRTGVAPFMAAMGGSSAVAPWYVQLISLVELNLSTQVILSVPALLAVFGTVALLARRQFLIPVWFVAIFMTTSRGSDEKDVIVLALLAGAGVAFVLIPLTKGDSTFGRLQSAPVRYLLPCLLGLFVFQSWVATGVSASLMEISLSPRQKAAMIWVRDHTPAKSQFLVLSGSPDWPHEVVGEWFYAFADRKSIATVQGTEWLPNGFPRAVRAYNAERKCAYRGAACVERWLTKYGRNVSYVFVANGHAPLASPAPQLWQLSCCASLTASLEGSRDFVRVFEGPGATVFKVISPTRRADRGRVPLRLSNFVRSPRVPQVVHPVALQWDCC